MEEIKKENNMLKPNSIEKRDKYNCFDGAIACCMFIVMQFVFELVYGALPSSFKQSLLVALFASFLVEAIFVFAAYIPAKTRNVNFFNATKLNKKPTIKSAALAVAISIISLICFSGLTNVFSEVLTKFGYKSSASFSVPNLFVYFIYFF